MKRSKHSLSHYKLLTCNQGQLIPVALVEALAGDTIQHATSALIRSSPLNTPVMHPVDIKFHHWFVPFRLIWDDWEDFITGGPDGMDDSTFPTITVPTGGFALKSLADYLGVPPSVAQGETVSALPFRAYSLIYNEFYRDQDLIDPVDISTASGADTTTNTSLLSPSWEKDYFTSSRPWTQKGPEVTVPLGERANINLDRTTGGAASVYSPTTGQRRNLNTSGSVLTLDASTNTDDTALYADLLNAEAPNVNLLRTAFALQRYEEARARYGSRYTEYLQYLGVKAQDSRLQRPEYLGGGKNTMQFSEVLQTTPDDPSTSSAGVGNMLGHGIGAVRSNRYRKFIPEHGYIITMMYVKPKTMYVQGLARTWNRRIKEDFWQKELEHIGQQEVLNKELYFAHSSPNGIFGYQDRYDEYRRMESTIAGEFRTTLNTWHYARIFASEPALNETFVTANPTTRVNQSASENTLWCMIKHSIQARRMVSKYAKSFIY